MDFSSLPLRRVEEHRHNPLPRTIWPATLAPVAQLLEEGLDLGPATVLLGENGAGKSTLVEAIAMAYGLNAEGGSTGAMKSTRNTESGLDRHLQLLRGLGASRWGYFLRAESMHGFFTYLETEARPFGGASEAKFHEMSHGESFIELISNRFDGPGLFVLDEPESALSFTNCLALLSQLKVLTATGQAQVIMSTHSPVLAALPGANIYELGPWGLRSSAWTELDVVQHWQSFLHAPERYLRHL